jgi:protein-S-isoprenylcysteine O-methyltransferase Ste14
VNIVEGAVYVDPGLFGARIGRQMLASLITKTVIWLAIMAVLLFVPAGTMAWPQAWVFLIELGVTSVPISAWLYVHDPALLAQRMASPVQREQAAWDRIFMICMLLLFVAWLVIMGLDAVRFRASHVPVWAQGAGAAGILLSQYVFWLVFRANSYAAPVVKIQKDRGHAIATSGPYAHVRHPMYAGAILFLLGTPLLLGSWFGLALAPIIVVGFAVRAVLEERALSAQFPSYADYAARVRYRFVPLIW